MGAFLGGTHCDDQYRPTDKSKMRDQSAPWGPVNADLLLEKIHTNSDMIKSFSPPNAAPISELTSNSALSLAIAPGVPFNDEISWEKVIGSTASAGLEIKSNTMVSSVINIEQSGQVVLDTFSIDIDIDHTYRGDLSIELISPSNTAVPISGYANGNLLDSLDSLGSSNTPNATTNFFATLEGESITGEWTLNVSDTAAGDEGILNSWGINYDTSFLKSGSSTLDLNQIDPGVFKVKATLSDPSLSMRMSATKKAASESVVWQIALKDTASEDPASIDSLSILFLNLLDTIQGFLGTSESTATMRPPVARKAAEDAADLEDAQVIPTLSTFALFILSGLMALFGLRRSANR